MKRALLVLVLFAAAPTWAARVAVCDPAHPSGVADAVVYYNSSANTPDYSSNPDALIHPDISAVQGVEPRIYWLCNRGANSVVPMSGAQKASMDAWLVSEADLGSDGVGDSGCLQNTLGSEINGSPSNNTVPWDTQMNRPPWKVRTYSHVGQAIAFCTKKAGLYAVYGALQISGASNYSGVCKLRKNGQADLKRWQQDGSRGCVFQDVWRSDGDDCVSIAVDRESGGGSVTVGAGSHICMTKVADRE